MFLFAINQAIIYFQLSHTPYSDILYNVSHTSSLLCLSLNQGNHKFALPFSHDNPYAADLHIVLHDRSRISAKSGTEYQESDNQIPHLHIYWLQ